MSYSEVGAKSYVKYGDRSKGDLLVEGYFRKKIHGRYGVQYEFEALTGEIVVLNSAGQLNYKMDFIDEGHKVKIIYDGKMVLESGPMAGKAAHQFKVLRDTSSDGEIGYEGDGGLKEATDDDIGLDLEDFIS